MLLMLSLCGTNHLRLNTKRGNAITARSREIQKRPIFGDWSPYHPTSLLPKDTVCIGRAQLPTLPRFGQLFASVSDTSCENGASNGASKSGVEKQKITVLGVGWNGMDHIAALLKSAQELYTQSQREGTKLFVAVSDRGSFYWRNVGTRPARLLQSVICDDGIAQTACADMTDFLGAATWYADPDILSIDLCNILDRYADRGIPYRRGYLLHGEPGTGKSSLVMALAGTLKMPVYQLSLSEQNLTDSNLTLLLNAVEANSIVLLEDVDAAFCDRAAREGSSLSFSGILNAIDGVAASEARILFMTTNHIDKLDPALVRPGRVDVKFEMSLATQPMIAHMFRHFYSHSSSMCSVSCTEDVVQDRKDISIPSHNASQQQLCNIHAMSETFSQLVPSKKFSMASVQVYLMQHKRDPSAALAQAALHFKSALQ
jgi:hypothetical protein